MLPYQSGDEEFKHPDRFATQGIAECQQYEDIGSCQQYTRPERKFREQEAERNGRTQQLREIRADDRNLRKDI